VHDWVLDGFNGWSHGGGPSLDVFHMGPAYECGLGKHVGQDVPARGGGFPSGDGSAAAAHVYEVLRDQFPVWPSIQTRFGTVRVLTGNEATRRGVFLSRPDYGGPTNRCWIILVRQSRYVGLRGVFRGGTANRGWLG
jgi:hypothetical protein